MKCCKLLRFINKQAIDRDALHLILLFFQDFIQIYLHTIKKQIQKYNNESIKQKCYNKSKCQSLFKSSIKQF